MLDAAFFVSDELHARDVELPDGTVHRLHFRELTTQQVRGYQLAERSDDEDVQAGAIARLLSSSLCEPDGKPALTYEQALKLKPVASSALLSEVLAINALASRAAKKPPLTVVAAGSGTS